MKHVFTLLFFLTGTMAMCQVYSATDSVIVTTINSSGFGNNSRGFEFIPNSTLTVTELGYRLPDSNGVYTWVIWETASQTMIHSQVSTLPNMPGVYEYEPISSPVSLSAGTSYTLSLYNSGVTSAGYYYGPSSQVNSNLTYVTMRYCNSCPPTQFPTTLYGNYHYGTPDFHFVICTAPTSSVTSATACNSYTSPSGDYVWTTSGTYYDTIANYQGCDSLMTINLTVNYSPTATITTTACDSYTTPSGNHTWTTSGTYYDTVPSGMGCDSIYTFNLTIGNSGYSTLTENACDSYTSPGGQVWMSSGTYYDTLTTVTGCDSIITINLTMGQSYSNVQTESVLDTYTWPVNGMTYTTSGTYTDSSTNVAGCDSVYVLDLTVQYTGLSEKGKSALVFYPNPAQDYIIVQLPEEMIGSGYAIIDNGGRVLLEGKVSAKEMKLDLSQMANGMYLFTVDEVLQQQFRIVKN